MVLLPYQQFPNKVKYTRYLSNNPDPLSSFENNTKIFNDSFVVVNFDALAQASDFRIERRQVVFLWYIFVLTTSYRIPYWYFKKYKNIIAYDCVLKICPGNRFTHYHLGDPWNEFWGISSCDRSTLIQINTCYHQTTCHYQCQYWSRPMSPYGVTGPQWVK